MRFALVLAALLSATPASAELACSMQHGRLVCDYSAALIADARQLSPTDPEVVAALVPAAYPADVGDYDRAPDAASSEALCIYTPTELAAPGC